MKDLIACCGLDCEKCDARIAAVTDDGALREKTAQLWSKLNGVEITPEMINCTGCRMEGVKTPFCDGLCEIRKCAVGRGFATCGDCPDMELCKTLEMVTANNRDTLANLKGGLHR